MTEVRGSPIAAAIDGYSETAKDLVREWSEYASDLSTRFGEDDYTADRAVADFTAGVVLAMQTGARLTWEAFDAMSILAGGLDQSYAPKSDTYSTHLSGAALALHDDLHNGFEDVLPKSDVEIHPTQLDPGEGTFTLKVTDASGFRAGLYKGMVVASTPDGQTEQIDVSVNV